MPYTKTASTYLQRNVFPQLDGVKYLNKPQDFYSYIHNTTTNKSDAILGKARDLANAKEKILISHEGYLSHKKDKQQKLKELFPEANLLIVVRNQFDIIISAYLQSLKYCNLLRRSGRLKISPLPILPFRSYLRMRKSLLLGYYNFPEVIKAYRELYEGNVKVVLFEDAVKNFDAIIEPIGKVFNKKDVWKLEYPDLEDDSPIKTTDLMLLPAVRALTMILFSFKPAYVPTLNFLRNHRGSSIAKKQKQRYKEIIFRELGDEISKINEELSEVLGRELPKHYFSPQPKKN